MTFAAAVVCVVLAQGPADVTASGLGDPWASAPPPAAEVVDAGDAPPVVEVFDAGAPAEVDLAAADAGVSDGPVTAEAAPEPVGEPNQPVTTRVTLNDGQVLVGTLIEDTAYSVTLRIGSGDEILLPRTAVKDVRAEERAYRTKTGRTWFEDANRTRYFYGPSAMMLKQGELGFSQYELLISSLSYGITDHVSVQAGAAVPVWFVEPPWGLNFLGAVKVGFSATELTHFALGAQVLALPAATRNASGIPVLGVAFGTVTYGQRDAHVSLSLGVPFVGFTTPNVGPVVGTLSGNYRVSEAVALVTENWVVANIDAFDVNGARTKTAVVINGLMARIMGERIAADLGALLLWEPRSGLIVEFPIPWLAFTYNFL